MIPQPLRRRFSRPLLAPLVAAVLLLPLMAVAAATLSPPVASAQQVIDINSASESELKKLPGVGKVTAARIVQWRKDNGGFKSKRDLLEVKGIGKKTFAKMEAMVSIGPAPAGGGAEPTPEEGARASGSGDDVIDLTEGGASPRKKAEPRAAAKAGGGGGGRININTASESELTTLHGIGPSKARAIIAHRTSKGPFKSVDDITGVHGIGKGTLARIRDEITVE